MTYQMRRSRQELPEEKAFEVLKQNNEGVLSLIDGEGLPYGVPLNYVVVESPLGDAAGESVINAASASIIMHSALSGHKIDAINANSAASFCVVEKGIIIPEEFATSYVSVIVAGQAKLLEDEAEKRDALMSLARITGQPESACENEVDRFVARCAVIQLDIESISGKVSKDLV